MLYVSILIKLDGKTNWGMRDTLALSSWKFKKLTNYNPIKNSLLNTEVSLRVPCTKTSKGGQLGKSGEIKREESSDAPQTQPCSRELSARPGEGRKPVVTGAFFSWPGGTESWRGSPAGWLKRTVTEPADAWPWRSSLGDHRREKKILPYSTIYWKVLKRPL